MKFSTFLWLLTLMACTLFLAGAEVAIWTAPTVTTAGALALSGLSVASYAFVLFLIALFRDELI